jgi:hypothetical protein
LQLSTSGAFPFNGNTLEMPELMMSSPLGRASRVVNMSQLGQALTSLGSEAKKDGPPVKAMLSITRILLQWPRTRTMCCAG